ncbi:flagellar biosynthetic protein FliO [Rhizobium sp. FKL33]|uniref:flagellar biosynthetic protein FliO n=1 Tax=Rhizobium sp. FKL33 TaxID=2562307 RepID=UPI001485A634|nr:flagellar biosynthetic protein FliO [Rhizobium sp. FKL33]
MLDGLAPDLAPRLVIAIGGVALAFVAFIVVLMFLKKRNSPLFIKGGRSREHRLHVLDAAAVDAKRRLVLIRRDDTEHLIMIGGPTDIVIETGIIPGRPLSGEIAQQLQAPAPAAIAAEPKPQPQIQPPQPQRRVEPPRQQEPRVAPPAAQAEKPREALARPTPAIAPPVQPAAASRPSQAEQPPAKPVEPRISNMGAMLYDEGREPFAGAKAPLSSMSAAQAQKAAQASPPATASQADAILEQARSRVLPPSAPVAETPAPRIENTSSDARLEAMRAEAAAKLEAARQAQTAPASRPAAAAPRPQASLPSPTPAPASNQDRLASDFASFLEAELEAGGVLADSPRAAAGPGQPGSGSAEQAVNRRLGEINVNKTDPA